MKHRPHRGAGRLAKTATAISRRCAWAAAALALVCVTPMTTGCATTVMQGRAASMMYDPDRVGGLPASHGPTGVRPDAPAPTGNVEGTDGGSGDQLALLAINDIQSFWTSTFPQSFSGEYAPVSSLRSYDSTNPTSPRVCGRHATYGEPNAAYCSRDDSVSWDRGVLIPDARKYFGDIAVAGLLAHEFGHAVQRQAHLVKLLTRTIVREQQADCFAGVYLRWVAQGRSPRFTMNTTDGLDHVLAGGITLRDPVDEPGNAPGAHGSALDRIGAFQEGFDGDPTTCGAIDKEEIARRRAGLPKGLQNYLSSDADPGEMPITDDSLALLMETLTQIFHPDTTPTLNIGGEHCMRGCPTQPTGLVLPCHQHHQHRPARPAKDGHPHRRTQPPAIAGRRHLLLGRHLALHAGRATPTRPFADRGARRAAHRMPDRRRSAQHVRTRCAAFRSRPGAYGR